MRTCSVVGQAACAIMGARAPTPASSRASVVFLSCFIISTPCVFMDMPRLRGLAKPLPPANQNIHHALVRIGAVFHVRPALAGPPLQSVLPAEQRFLHASAHVLAARVGAQVMQFVRILAQ